LEYLAAVTVLLQAARRANRTGGVWEAADLQWWWRRDQHRDAARQTFWFDDGIPVAASVLTDWGGRFGCDVLGAGHDSSAVIDVVWPRTLEQIDAVADAPVEMAVGDDDTALIEAVTTAGFKPTDEVGVETWMNVGEPPQVPVLPGGFTLRSRSDVSTRPHHMIGRNGARIADRLAKCSLYRADLDPAIYDSNGEVAAYGLFWADPVTGVGLVEPMRTEDRYQRRGLGRCLLAAGLDRLAGEGYSRFVSPTPPPAAMSVTQVRVSRPVCQPLGGRRPHTDTNGGVATSTRPASAASRWASSSSPVAAPNPMRASRSCSRLARSSAAAPGNANGAYASAATSTKPASRSIRGSLRPSSRSTPRSVNKARKPARIRLAR
jgi:GNAT superfamily N-acetyltransferase